MKVLSYHLVKFRCQEKSTYVSIEQQITIAGALGAVLMKNPGIVFRDPHYVRYLHFDSEFPVHCVRQCAGIYTMVVHLYGVDHLAYELPRRVHPRHLIVLFVNGVKLYPTSTLR